MKKVFLLALATALTIGSFAADKNKARSKKTKKAAKTEQCCTKPCDVTKCTPKPCDETKCTPKPGCCKM